MRINTGLKVLAGAVALALSGGAFAATSTAGSGSVVLVLEDTTAGTQYVYDTSLSVTAGNPGSFSKSLATDANYQSFESTIGSGDSVTYALIGADSSNNLLVTGVSAPTVKGGLNSTSAASQFGTFLNSIVNPSGGSTFTAASDLPSNKYAAQYEPGINTSLGVTDGTSVGTALSFYQVLTTSTAARSGAAVSTLASTWTLSSTGLLTYGSTTAPVPLPAPLVLLLSGLGLMGVVARRRQSSATDVSFNGMAV